MRGHGVRVGQTSVYVEVGGAVRGKLNHVVRAGVDERNLRWNILKLTQTWTNICYT